MALKKIKAVYKGLYDEDKHCLTSLHHFYRCMAHRSLSPKVGCVDFSTDDASANKRCWIVITGVFSSLNLATLTPHNVNVKICAVLPGLCFCATMIKKVKKKDMRDKEGRAVSSPATLV